jgi:hypothetical protein
MGVDVLEGSPRQLVLPTGFLVGGSNAKVLYTNQGPAQVLASLHLAVTTTATAGTRLFFPRIIDFAGNVLYEGFNGTQGASLTFRYMYGSFMPIFGPAGVLNLSIQPMPYPSIIPPGGQLVFGDINNTDVNDSLGAPGVLVLTE